MFSLCEVVNWVGLKDEYGDETSFIFLAMNLLVLRSIVSVKRVLIFVYGQVMYRPPKDLNGIPGAKGLVMCLTGYQRQDRDDIMVPFSLSLCLIS